MTHTMLFIPLLVAGFVVGCSSTAGKPAVGQDNRGASPSQSGEVQQQASNSPPKGESYTYEKKAEFTRAVQHELTRVEREIDELSAKLESTSGAVQAEAKGKLLTLRDQAAKLNEQLEQAKSASESVWERVKRQVKQTSTELEDSVRQTRRWLSAKTAPES